MKEGMAATDQKNIRSKTLPVIVFLILFLCSGGALFALWKKHAASQESYHASIAAQNDAIESLRQQKTQLEGLLQQDPCTVRQSLGLPSRPVQGGEKTAPTPPQQI